MPNKLSRRSFLGALAVAPVVGVGVGLALKNKKDYVQYYNRTSNITHIDDGLSYSVQDVNLRRIHFAENILNQNPLYKLLKEKGAK